MGVEFCRMFEENENRVHGVLANCSVRRRKDDNKIPKRSELHTIILAVFKDAWQKWHLRNGI